jgi:hypothetical protein
MIKRQTLQLSVIRGQNKHHLYTDASQTLVAPLKLKRKQLKQMTAIESKNYNLFFILCFDFHCFIGEMVKYQGKSLSASICSNERKVR